MATLIRPEPQILEMAVHLLKAKDICELTGTTCSLWDMAHGTQEEASRAQMMPITKNTIFFKT